MKALELLEPYWNYFQQLFTYCQYCIGAEMHAPACRDFWIWVVCGSFGIGALIFILIVKTVLKEQLEYYRNKKRLEARKIVADEETMAEAKWKGEDVLDVEVPHEELAERMREALNARTRPAAASPAK